MMLTVGIPVYNGEKYIREAIESVLNQSFHDFELIITDDGSTDSSLEIVRSIIDPRVIVVCDGMHKGLAIRLNEQIAMAKGSYFVRMDADDVMLPQRLEKQLAFLKRHPETDIVGSSVIVIDENGKRIGWRDSDFSSAKVINDSNEIVYACVRSFMHPTVVGKIDWFRRYYYNPACEGCEDMDLWARSIDNSVFYALKEPLLLYRDPQSINLSTYLFRRRQERYVLRVNRERISCTEYHIRWLKSIFKTMIVFCAVKFKYEKYILRARNQSVLPKF